MTRDVSAPMRRAVYARETDQAFILTLTIDHESLEQPIRVTPDPVEDLPVAGVPGLVSRGDEYVFLPFNVVLPNQDDSESPRSSLQIDNISREIVRAVRTINSPADVSFEIVMSDTPDVVEASFDGFQLRDVTYNKMVVEGELTIEQYELEPYPSGRMNPSNFPGCF